ncbi:hypothetical protein CEE37_08715 [candidate division LCP-89 bacterium B3_LCP]|uniref:Uncharacterized protein n=1 Tax=candidate division LCP-89 bacterium B3_LCP TaxID=2012998 RepID=A0A532UZL2_UNCL8|nr:MAG: hypothetical protein CEE37_08715 [candidate division LCP-89 bacterium B3_LCP]
MSIIVIFSIFVLLPQPSSAQLKFDEGVWVSYTDFRHVVDVDVGKNYIYVATSGGVLRYHRYKKRWEDPWVVVRGYDNAIDLRTAANVDYLSDTDEVAVLTTRGAFVYNPVFKYWKPTTHSFATPQQIDLTDAVFLKTPDFTISHRTYFPQGNNMVMDNKLRKYPLTVYADDEWGNWWIGLDGVGVLQLDIHSKRGTVWEMGFFGTNVQAIARGKGWTISAGQNRNGGITFWKRRANIWDHLEPAYTTSLESAWINDIAVAGKYALAATDNGLTKINLKNGNCDTWNVHDGLWSNRTVCVAVDKDTAWVGTEDGVCKVFLPKGPIVRMQQPALGHQIFYDIAVDKQAIWCGGNMGLYRLDRETGKGGYLGLSGGVGGPVYSIHSTNSEIWVGRMSGVEVINKRSLKQTGYPSYAHMHGAEIYAVYAKGNLAWVGTNSGLWKFDRSRNYWHQYTYLDGLLDNRVYEIYPDGDYLLIGTASGVTRFFWNDPDRVD